MSDPAAPPGDDGARATAVLAALLAAVDPVRAVAAAARLVAAFGSLGAVGRATRGQLVPLVGDAVADLLQAHRAAMLWTLREAAVAGPVVATGHELLEYLHHRLAAEPDEVTMALFLNGRRELIAEEVLARGGPAGIALAPRPVIARALAIGATRLILVHNHPSGDPRPSAADRRFTHALREAGRWLDVRVDDHLVIARDGHRSVLRDDR